MAMTCRVNQSAGVQLAACAVLKPFVQAEASRRGSPQQKDGQRGAKEHDIRTVGNISQQGRLEGYGVASWYAYIDTPICAASVCCSYWLIFS
jgi:hypothetical protein